SVASSSPRDDSAPVGFVMLAPLPPSATSPANLLIRPEDCYGMARKEVATKPSQVGDTGVGASPPTPLRSALLHESGHPFSRVLAEGCDCEHGLQVIERVISVH